MVDFESQSADAYESKDYRKVCRLRIVQDAELDILCLLTIFLLLKFIIALLKCHKRLKKNY